MTDALTDEALRDQFRQPTVYSLVYRTYASQVLGYLTARGVEDPEAAMQEVFLSVLPRLDSVRGGAAGLRTFIFSVAHARMVDDHRRQSRTPAQVTFEPELDRREDASAESEARWTAFRRRKSSGCLMASPMTRGRSSHCALLPDSRWNRQRKQ